MHNINIQVFLHKQSQTHTVVISYRQFALQFASDFVEKNLPQNILKSAAKCGVDLKIVVGVSLYSSKK